MRNVGIRGVGHYLPEEIRTNEQLEQMVDTTGEWIFSKTGIKQRHIAAEKEATSDLALQASLRALDDAGLQTRDIDLIIVATSSPDMVQPSTAAILQGKLGATNAAAFDVGAVCSGFVYALVTATAMMRAFDNYQTVLVVGAETYSRIMDWTDRSTCVFFGDGAGAVVLTHYPEGGYLGHHLMADGTGANAVKIPAGGSRLPATSCTVGERLHYFKMDGEQVWDFAMWSMPRAVRKAVADAGCDVSQIDVVVPHQANINIIKRGMENLGLPMEKTLPTIEHTANTAGASVPIALSIACAAGAIKPGNLVALVSVGAGWTWGSAIFRWVRRDNPCRKTLS